MTHRALIYCRISADPEGKGLGVERQLSECRDLADRLGWTVIEGVLKPDNDISAYSGKPRPQYRKMLAEIKAGRADAVIAWHTDRLYRRLSELEEFIDVVNAHQVKVRTVKAGEVDLTTPTGRAMARTAAVWAGHEVEHAIERMNSEKQDMAVKGKYRGSSRPFGFEADGVTVRKREADAIADATHRVLGGEYLGTIAREWQEQGLETARGGQWRNTAVRYILARARNAGMIERHGEEVGEAEWPAIVSVHEWRGVKAMLSDPSRNTTPTRDRRWLGSGLYLCGKCGEKMRIGRSKGVSAYRCKAHGHLSRHAEPVDEYVTEVVLARIEGGVSLLEDEDDRETWQAEANAIREQLEELRRALGSREIDLRTFKVASEAMQADLAETERKLAASAARSPLAGLADAEDSEAAWYAESFGVPRQRAVIDALFTVTLLPTRPGRKPGGGYFDPDTVDIVPKKSPEHFRLQG